MCVIVHPAPDPRTVRLLQLAEWSLIFLTVALAVSEAHR